MQLGNAPWSPIRSSILRGMSSLEPCSPGVFRSYLRKTNDHCSTDCALARRRLSRGADIAKAAGAFVLGGHSVDDPEPKYGMVAIGEVHPNRIVTLARARPGDALVLTKPIGTGVLTTALKHDLATAAEIAPAVAK